MFQNVNTTKGYSIQEIIPVKGFRGEGGESIQFVDADGNMGTQVWWYAKSATGLDDGWYNEDETKSDITISNGQSFLVACDSDEYQIQFAGQVNYKAGSVASTGGFVVIGNATPVSVNIQEFAPISGFKGEGGESLQLVNADGNMGTQYFYYKKSAVGLPDGWYDEYENKVDVSFAPGQGFLVYCANPFEITIPAVK